jgi:PAS domain S-box-containing protein
VVVVLCLLVASAVSYKSTRDFAEAGRAVVRSQEVLRELEGTLSSMKDVRNAELQFLVSGGAKTVRPFAVEVPQLATRLQRLARLTMGSHLQGRVLELQKAIENRRAEIARITDAADSVIRDRLLNSSVPEVTYAQIRAMAGDELELLKLRSETLKIRASLASYSLLTVSLLTLGFAAFVFHRLARDIRDRRRSMEWLRLSEERYRLLAENSLDLIALLDPKGTLIYASPSHQQVLGLPPSCLIGQNLAALIHPEDLATVRLTISQLTPASPKRAVDVRLRKAGGVWLECDLSLSTFTISGVPGQRILLSARDISERRLVQQEREKLIRELQEALAKIRVLSGFIPICAGCKKIRDDQGYWNQLEAYIQSHSEAQFSHGVCPDCAAALYPDYFTQGA